MNPLRIERIATTLSAHVEELLAFCREAASPLPTWRTILVLNTADPGVRYDRGWVAARDALCPVPEFAAHFDRLLMAGYSWINLSAYGLFRGDLIIGIELPREPLGVPGGLTSVNYSGPSHSPDGKPSWDLNLVLV